MSDKTKNNLACDEVASRPSRPVPSLFRALEEVKAQVEYEGFAQPAKNGALLIDPLYKEIYLTA